MYGYKILTSDMKNRYGVEFKIGETKTIEGDIKWGPNGNGFHFCKNLEDCFRYMDAFNEDTIIARVKGYGDLQKVDDEYNGYYEMYVCRNIEVIRVLDRDEIIKTVLKKNNIYAYRNFISTFPLTDEEIKLFSESMREGRTTL